MISVTLPWPHRDLSPNRARNVHWSKKAIATKSAKERAYYTLMGRSDTNWHPLRGVHGLSVSYAFHPPDNRRRDFDNMIGCTKAYTDGLAQALGVDDSTFRLGYEMGSTRLGVVEVTITHGLAK